MNCNTCKMCQSADKKLENFVASKSGEFETAFQRTIDQKVKCGFGLQGVCCRLCSNGPCRVTPKSPRCRYNSSEKLLESSISRGSMLSTRC